MLVVESRDVNILFADWARRWGSNEPAAINASHEFRSNIKKQLMGITAAPEVWRQESEKEASQGKQRTGIRHHSAEFELS